MLWSDNNARKAEDCLLINDSPLRLCGIREFSLADNVQVKGLERGDPCMPVAKIRTRLAACCVQDMTRGESLYVY